MTIQILARAAAAVPGTGWGCVQCGLPMDGASYLACDVCIEANREPRHAILGYLSDRKREPIENVYARQKHEHDMQKHPEVLERQAEFG
jgi:hypothetical protein